MIFESFVALRMSGRTSGRNGGPGVGIAMVGIALSFVIMLVSISIVTGFKRQITEKIVGFNADFNVYGLATTTGNGQEPDKGIRLTPRLKATIEEATGSSEIYPVFNQPALLKTDDNFAGLILRGIGNGKSADFISSALVEGSMPSDSAGHEIAVSRTTATALELRLGDKVFCHFIEDNRIRSRSVTISGIFDTHFSEYDTRVAIAPISMLQNLNRVGSDVGTSIEIHGVPLDEIEDKSVELYNGLLQLSSQEGSSVLYQIDNVLQTGAMYFSWLDLLDTNVVVILLLMGVVSAFTLISALFIIILRNVAAIGLLKALGATNTQIRTIFILIAQKVVALGLLIGNIIGLSVIFWQRTTHFLPLDAEAYYLDFVPMELEWWTVLTLNIAVILISAAVLILPSHIVAKLSPGTTLAYE